jgi:glycosyltransferase involved in cell wall biosynthesis
MTSRTKRVLWVKADPLHPLDSGGRIRTYHVLRLWQRRHDVTYLALFPQGTPDEARRNAGEYSSHQAWVPWSDVPKGSLGFYLDLLRNLLLSRSPYVIDKYRSGAATSEIARLEREQPFDLVVADFLSMTPNIVAAGIDPGKVVVYQHNVESQIWKRHYTHARNLLTRAYMYVQWRRYERFEREMCGRFAGVVAVSEDDATRFVQDMGLRNVLGHTPTGVDVEHFRAAGHDPEPGHLVFLGSMDWMPNIDGIEAFVRDVFPRIRHACPDARLTIVGRNPVPRIRALETPDSGIHVTGTVDDVRPYLRRAAVSVVPLSVGGGTRIKIFEAMAVGVPVVSTRVGAEGLPVVDGTHLLIADEAEAFARSTLELLRDPARGHSIGRAGQELVEARFSWDVAAERFEALTERIGALPDRPAGRG